MRARAPQPDIFAVMRPRRSSLISFKSARSMPFVYDMAELSEQAITLPPNSCTFSIV